LIKLLLNKLHLIKLSDEEKLAEQKKIEDKVALRQQKRLIKLARKERKREKKDLQRVEEKLLSKYGKKPKSAELIFAKRTKIKKVTTIISTVFIIVLSMFCVMLTTSNIFCTMYDSCPTIAGYSSMTVMTGSMNSKYIYIDGVAYESNLKIGDNIVVRGVDAETIKIGDKIAFYVYDKNYKQFNFVKKERIYPPSTTQTKYKTSFLQFFGFQSKEICEASSNGARLVIHHVTDVFRDENGKLWFNTRGSSNEPKDNWFISEEMVVGIYCNTGMAAFISIMTWFTSTTPGFVSVIIIPFVLVMILVVMSFIQDIRLGFIIMDVIEERLKLTDPVCIKHEVGFRMNKKEKLKVLVQANDEEKATYVSLLWKQNEIPFAIKKYALRKKILLAPIKKMLDLNRECQEMYKTGEDSAKIAKYYLKEKKKIERQQEKVDERVKNIRKQLKKEND